MAEASDAMEPPKQDWETLREGWEMRVSKNTAPRSPRRREARGVFLFVIFFLGGGVLQGKAKERGWAIFFQSPNVTPHAWTLRRFCV